MFEPVRTSVPTLIVTGTLDPITPTTWGQRLLGYMPNARLIDVTGMSHGMAEMNNFIPCLLAWAFHSGMLERRSDSTRVVLRR